MSYDISIQREVYEDNYTSNVREMFCRAFENEDGIKCLNNLYMSEARPRLMDAIEYFYDNKEDLEKLNPENGWGNYKGALKVLRNMLFACNYELENCNDSIFKVSC